MASAHLDRVLRQVDARDLEVLLVVAENGSFRKAGARLDIGQSAVSRRIQKLEDLLGVSLFERRSTGARLTHAGSEFVACSGAIFENLKAAVVRAQTMAIADEGSLQIGSATSLSTGPHRSLIRQFARHHPRVRLQFVECGRRELMTMLTHRTLDAVVSVGDIPENDGASLVLSHSPVFLAVAKDSLLAKKIMLDWRDVTDLQFLVSARESGPDIHDFIVRKSTKFGRSVLIARHQVSRDGIMSLVGIGLGVTVIADHAAGITYPDVSFVPLVGGGERIPFSLNWLPENDNPALRRFISLARLEAKKNGLPY